MIPTTTFRDKRTYKFCFPNHFSNIGCCIAEMLYESKGLTGSHCLDTGVLYMNKKKIKI